MQVLAGLQLSYHCRLCNTVSSHSLCCWPFFSYVLCFDSHRWPCIVTVVTWISAFQHCITTHNFYICANTIIRVVMLVAPSQCHTIVPYGWRCWRWSANTFQSIPFRLTTTSVITEIWIAPWSWLAPRQIGALLRIQLLLLVMGVRRGGKTGIPPLEIGTKK